MSIRDNYIRAFNSIAQRHGERHSNARIGPWDSLRETIGYTREYVVEHTTPHYRYQYYHGALSGALKRLPFDPADRPLVHLDIGCGPGVFSWVMYDYMASQEKRDPGRVAYYGYDHCAAMIELAHLFLGCFPDPYEFRGFSDLAEISKTLTEEDLSNCDVVVTFGYALVQVRDDPVALRRFATLIKCVLPSHSCIIVAADARSTFERGAFRDQCRELETALNSVGVALENCLIPTFGSTMSARLTME